MRVHTFKKENTYIAFFPETLRFFEINESTEDLISSCRKSIKAEDIIQKYNISLDDYNNFIDMLNSYAINVEGPANLVQNEKGLKILDRLVINVSNDCNLNCKYCYANGGTYNSQGNMMSADVAKKTIDLFLSEFDRVNVIQLFGGEPLLNIPIIEVVLNTIKEMYQCGRINYNPSIGIVTNGTIMNDKVIDLVKDNNINVTVSLDGPDIVNDIMRVYKNGKGTYKKIETNIKKLKEYAGQPTTIEVTYNKHHIDNNISIVDIIEYFNNAFSDVSLHIVPVSGTKEKNYTLENREAFIDSVKDIFEAKEFGKINYSLVQRIIEALKIKKQTKYMCTAGIGTLSISTQGDIYPCFMFTDEEGFSFGNIFDKDILKSIMKTKIFKELADFSKFNDKRCKDCFIYSICSGCLGANYFETGEVHNVDKENCDMQRRMVESVLYFLTKIKKQTISVSDC